MHGGDYDHTNECENVAIFLRNESTAEIPHESLNAACSYHHDDALQQVSAPSGTVYMWFLVGAVSVASSVNKRQVEFNPSLVQIDNIINFAVMPPPPNNAHVLQNSWIIWELKEKQQNMDVSETVYPRTEP